MTPGNRKSFFKIFMNPFSGQIIGKLLESCLSKIFDNLSYDIAARLNVVLLSVHRASLIALFGFSKSMMSR